MSGRSFATSPEHGAADATDPEYLRDLQKYLEQTNDQRPFYKAMMLTLANSDASTWRTLSPLGQSVLSDFLTVYTAEAVRHLMVYLQDGMHPWKIDLAAVTFVSTISQEIGKVVVEGALENGDLGRWFAPSPRNVPGGPQRSGIGITRRDRKILQRAIHNYEISTPEGRKVIEGIQAIIGTDHNNGDVIQGVFEFLSRKQTPERMGPKGAVLADLMADLAHLSRKDANKIAALIKK